MEKIKDKSVIIFDYGMAVPHAQRLAREFGKVGYFSPWTSSFPNSNDSIVGEGFDGVTRLLDFWQEVDKYDCVYIPDTHCGDIVSYLRKKGYKVFGADSKSTTLELDRWKGRKIQQAVGLPVQRTEHIVGLFKLRKHLGTVKDRFVKLSLFRGAIETFKHDSIESSQPYLDKLAVALYPKQDEADFIVEELISGSEAGTDTFVVDGNYSDYSMYGWEVKDKYYVGKCEETNKVPKPLKEVNDKLATFFKKCGTRSMFSTEVKITKDGKPYLIDPTVRMPLPPSYIELEMYSNFGEFIYNAAQGKLIPLKPTAKYGVEVILSSDFSMENILEVKIPKEQVQWVKLANGCKINGKFYILPGSPKDHYLSVVGLGDTVESAVNHAQNTIDKIEAFQLQKSFDKQAIFDKVAEGKKQGLKF